VSLQTSSVVERPEREREYVNLLFLLISLVIAPASIINTNTNLVMGEEEFSCHGIPGHSGS